jgi:hypothetical protein
MSFPQFVKAGVPTVTLTRGQTWPAQTSIETGQVVALTDGAAALALKFALPRWRYTVQLVGLSQSDFSALWAFLWHPLLDGSQQPFTWVDELGVSRQVRWLLDSAFTWQESSAGRLDVTLVLREEGV